MSSRKHRSARERERLFQLHGCRCHLCGEVIHFPEPWDLDHVIEWTLTRDDSDENVKPAHVACHGEKSGKRIKEIRKADRIRQKHNGSWPKPLRKLQSRGFQKRGEVSP